MTVIEFNIAKIGPTEPTYKHPDIYVDEDREYVFKKVARIAMTLSEISPFSRDWTLVHCITKKPLTKEWLREYLAKAIHFHYPPEQQYKNGRVPEWLPAMMMERVEDFIHEMWC